MANKKKDKKDDKKADKKEDKKDEAPKAKKVDEAVLKHGSEEAVAAAKEKMQAFIDAQKRGEEIQVEQGSLETSDTEVKKTKKSKKSDFRQRAALTSIDNVKIYSPFRVYFDGEADSVSAVNQTGPFDILAGHKNFMTLLIPCEIVIRSARGEERIKMDRGIMHVKSNAVTVFLDV